MLATIKDAIKIAVKEIETISALKPTSKGEIGNIVTLADKKSEEVITRELKKKFPNCQFLPEESKSEVTADNFKEIELLFVIDPIDGTSNYFFNIPQSAISVGAYEFGKPKYGVIYDISLKDIYEAEAGKGFFLNGKRVKKRKTPILEEAIIGSSWGYGKTPQVLIKKWEKLVGKVAMLRVMGSAALDMTMTAGGQFTCYIHNPLTPYDSGAGLLMMKEMGIKATNWQGKEFTVFDKEIIAAPPEIYDEFYNLLFD